MISGCYIALIYMQQRYCDPVIGRFYSNDPVGFSADNPMMFNRYTYANNNPYKYTDPKGETPLALLGAVIGGIGAVTTTLLQTKGEASWQQIGASAVGGAAVGFVAGATMGTSLLAGAVTTEFAATVATAGVAGFSGDVIGQGISKGVENIDVGSAVATGVLSTIGGASGMVMKEMGASAAKQLIVTEAVNTYENGVVKPMIEEGVKNLEKNK